MRKPLKDEDVTPKTEKEKREAAYELYSKPSDGKRKESTAVYLRGIFDAEIKMLPPPTYTGIDPLDDITGGLPVGLTILIAPSSTGKTTFALQLADQIATAGHDVLYFSLEQSTLELIAKSLNRYIHAEDPCTTITAKEIAGTRPEARTPATAAAIERAAAAYTADTGGRLSIIECDFMTTYKTIRSKAIEYAEETGTRPLIIIDYLQVIYSPDEHRTRRDAIDDTTIALRLLARDFKMPVLAIASVNSQSRLVPLAADSAKESTDTGYRADLTIGLQYSIMEDETRCALEYGCKTVKEKQPFNPFMQPTPVNQPLRDKIIKAEKEKPEREISLVILKNRFGTDGTINMVYTPAADTFRLTKAQANAAAETRIKQWEAEGAAHQMTLTEKREAARSMIKNK